MSSPRLAGSTVVLMLSLIFNHSAAFAGEMDYQTSSKVAGYFETARDNESTLVAFLHHMPKGADLHNHLWGDVEAETFLETALARGLYFDRAEKSFVAEKPAGPHFTPEQMVENFWNRAEVLEGIGMRNVELGGESGHGHFFRAFYRFLPAVPEERDMLRDTFRRAVRQRIGYLELMTYPGDAAWVADAEKIKDEVLAEFAEQGLVWELEVNFIYPLDRNSDLDSFREQLAKGLEAVADPQRHTVALTLLSPEDDHISQRDFPAQMAALDEAWRRLDRNHTQAPAKNPPPPRFAIHGGELTMEYAAYDSMLDRISKTIELGHASRIGHGVSIMWEDRVYDLLARMRERRVAVEICLTSNDAILKVGGGDRHPFRLYWEAGVPVVLATDDQGLSRSNLTLEYAKAADWFGLSYGELKWLAFSGLEYSFLPGASLFLEGDFNRPAPNRAELLKNSAKARRQAHLLQAFAEYEKYMEGVIGQFGWDAAD